MTERTALGLVFAATLISTAVGFLGLHALGANEQTLGLWCLIPLLVGPPVASRVVMHYGSSKRDRR
jgi:hypothetical protein